jgi:hypothetical protein
MVCHYMLIHFTVYMETPTSWLDYPQMVYMLALAGCFFAAPLVDLAKADLFGVKSINDYQEAREDRNNQIR